MPHVACSQSVGEVRFVTWPLATAASVKNEACLFCHMDVSWAAETRRQGARQARTSPYKFHVFEVISPLQG